MPNSYPNAGLEPEEAASGAEDRPGLGIQNDDELEEDLSDESEESDLIEDSDEKTDDETEEDFDLDEDAEVTAPIFSAGAAALAVDSDAGEEGTSGEDDDSDEDESAEDENPAEDNIMVTQSKIVLARQLLENIENCTARLNSILGGLLTDGDEERIGIAEISDGILLDEEEDSNIVEGVFDGENMIGPDGKEYSVPANYASKSKLVEGDMLKLTITDRGTFLYKQTKPVERKRLIGKLEKDGNGNYQVLAEHKKFRVITASITYYKGVPGDKVVILVPVSGDSAWAAVENVIKSK